MTKIGSANHAGFRSDSHIYILHTHMYTDHIPTMTRLVPIMHMLLKLPIILCSNAQNFAYYAQIMLHKFNIFSLLLLK